MSTQESSARRPAKLFPNPFTIFSKTKKLNNGVRVINDTEDKLLISAFNIDDTCKITKFGFVKNKKPSFVHCDANCQTNKIRFKSQHILSGRTGPETLYKLSPGESMDDVTNIFIANTGMSKLHVIQDRNDFNKSMTQNSNVSKKVSDKLLKADNGGCSKYFVHKLEKHFTDGTMKTVTGVTDTTYGLNTKDKLLVEVQKTTYPNPNIAKSSTKESGSVAGSSRRSVSVRKGYSPVSTVSSTSHARNTVAKPGQLHMTIVNALQSASSSNTRKRSSRQSNPTRRVSGRKASITSAEFGFHNSTSNRRSGSVRH